MKTSIYHCDRCEAKATGNSNDRFDRLPSGWILMSFDQSNHHLCPTCAEDIRLAIRNLMRGTNA
jgi:hypothetical protein